jgi:hypothetical protein
VTIARQMDVVVLNVSSPCIVWDITCAHVETTLSAYSKSECRATVVELFVFQFVVQIESYEPVLIVLPICGHNVQWNLNLRFLDLKDVPHFVFIFCGPGKSTF